MKTYAKQEILGYKFKPGFERYESAAKSIANLTGLDLRTCGTLFDEGSNVMKKLKQAGVLDVWFEPVYASQFKQGDIIYVIDGGCGALGANDLIGRIISRHDVRDFINGDSEGNIRIDIVGRKSTWILALDAKIRYATKEEFEQAIGLKKTFTLQCQDGSFDIEVSKKGIYYAPDNKYLDVDSLKAAVRIDGRTVSIDGRTVSGYSFTYTHIDSGCKKQVPISDWHRVIKYYDSINF